jgi:hypothetical protein
MRKELELHPVLHEALKDKIVDCIFRVSGCDEGIIIHFTDGTKLDVGWSGNEGLARLNNEIIECSGS